jgi:hypothetical protein
VLGGGLVYGAEKTDGLVVVLSFGVLPKCRAADDVGGGDSGVDADRHKRIRQVRFVGERFDDHGGLEELLLLLPICHD